MSKKFIALAVILLLVLVSPGFAQVEVQQNGVTAGGGSAIRLNFKASVTGQGTDRTILTSELVGTLDEGWDLSAATILNSDGKFSSSSLFYSGTAVGENAVFTEVGSSGLKGSLYISTSGQLFIQVSSSFTNADWQLITSSSAE